MTLRISKSKQIDHKLFRQETNRELHQLVEQIVQQFYIRITKQMNCI